MKLNRSNIKSSIAAATAFGIVAVSMPAYAGTGTSNMTVSSNIDVSCVLSTTNIDFDGYDATGANSSIGDDLTATGTISSTCTIGSGGNIRINQGLHASGGSTDAVPARRMKHATLAEKFLAYNVFSDELASPTLWENATGVAYNGTGKAEPLVVYGIIPKDQTDAPEGSYTDTLVVTINY